MLPIHHHQVRSRGLSGLLEVGNGVAACAGRTGLDNHPCGSAEPVSDTLTTTALLAARCVTDHILSHTATAATCHRM